MLSFLIPVLFFSLIPLVWAAFHAPLAPTFSSTTANPPEEFNWSSITPSTALNYTSCYTNFECARLILPLDYLNTTPATAKQTIALAIIRLPSTTELDDDDDPASPNTNNAAADGGTDGGTILFNPGGPGGSGIDFLLRVAPRVRRILNASATKKFSLLSFDPRGMHRSTPSLTCFARDLDRALWSLKLDATGNLDTGIDALRTYWAATEGLGRLCGEREAREKKKNGDKGEGRIGSFMSTPSVATDMLRIVEAVDEYERKHDREDGRAEQQASSLHFSSSSSFSSLLHPHSNKNQNPITSSSPNQDIEERRSPPPPLLQYWGFSYGTILGQFFATLYPERVGRMVLDGVADVDDFVQTGWTTNLQDSERTMSSFWEYCYNAGVRCPLYATADPTNGGPAAIAARIGTVLTRLRTSPRPITYRGTSSLITYSDIRNLIFETLYDPWANTTAYPGYDNLARVIATLLLPDDDEAGNREKVAEVVGPFLPSVQGPESRSGDGEGGDGKGCDWIPPPRPSKLEASPAVFCTDGIAEARNDTFADFVAKYRLLTSQSPTIGANWVKIPTMCHAWPFRAEWRYAGPFMENRTRYPVLLVGNEADPVTPVRNAEKVAKKEGQRGEGGGDGARVLLQEGPGHCSLAGKSSCTEYFIRRYFADGVLPEEGTRCTLDCRPWEWDLVGDCKDMGDRRGGGLEEVRGRKGGWLG